MGFKEKVLMRKKIIIAFSFIFIALLAVLGYGITNRAFSTEDMLPSEYKIGIPYSKALQSDKPAIVLFYTDWCGYCKRFMPKFKIINKLYKDDYNFVMLNTEAQDNAIIVSDAAITGLPTLYIFDPKYENRVHLTNGIYMDLKKLRKELDRYLTIRKRLDFSENCVAKQF